ncbi:MAG: type I-U CRISPR-associated helicase/endonuclease Cas3 [Gemmatimonadota bacterium]
MIPLSADEFAAFHEEVHGYPPFPWQDRILRWALQNRRFPDLVDVPTGVGKTTLMDVSLFALAVDASNPTKHRWVPRRIFLVVDRRIIVDQAGHRALKLSRLLERAMSNGERSSTVGRVALALSSLSGGGEPLTAAILRGGTLRDDNWARRPDQPVLGASTVDQVGSRLLFSGYGVGGRSASIHAGLLGHDTLFLLDEVHLSQPFRETLGQLRHYSGHLWRREQVAPPTQSVELSATPGEDPVGSDRKGFGLDEQDLGHPLIQKRIQAPKPVELALTSSGTQKAFVREFVKRSRELLKRHKTVGVVVNRVASARAICGALHEHAESRGYDVVLVTGRMRALDRQDLLDAIAPRIYAGRTRLRDDRPLVLVATQCIEAGADLDFDAMVTECASFDALRQRFGRLDRLGEYGQAEGVVVARKTDVSASGGDDPIYGDSLRDTWSWLVEQEAGLKDDRSLDFGIQAVAAYPVPPGLSAPAPSAPVMLPAHLDAWAQTGPEPAVQPDISLWLHGPEERAKDIQLVWRSDISEEELEHEARAREAATRHARLAGLLDRLSLAPPASPETLAVPLSAVRGWLDNEDRTETPVSDVEGIREETTRRPQQLRPVLAWEGDHSRVITRSQDLRPGMTLVVPATYGGLSMGSWDPVAEEPVADLGDRSQLVARGRVALRLHPALFSDDVSSSIPSPKPDETRSRAEDLEDIRRWLATAANREDVAPWLKVVRGEVDAAGDQDVVLRTFRPLPGSGREWWGIALRTRRPLRLLRELRVLEAARGREGARTGEYEVGEGSGLEHFVADFDAGEHSSFVARDVELDDHLEAVGTQAREFARELGLPERLRNALWWAGRLHDLGKADPRFQLWLHGGDEIELAAGGRYLAKSPLPSQDGASRRAARERAGYPAGLRHEMASTAMVAGAETFLSRLEESDLLLHLISSHHGWGRPFAPAVLDENPTDISFSPADERLDFHCSSSDTLAAADSGIAERFWRLTQRFGWHGLAFLEAILRLADHRVSEAEEKA